MSVYHYNVVDKLRLTFIGKTTEEIEKQKAFVSAMYVHIRMCRCWSWFYIRACILEVEPEPTYLWWGCQFKTSDIKLVAKTFGMGESIVYTTMLLQLTLH